MVQKGGRRAFQAVCADRMHEVLNTEDTVNVQTHGTFQFLMKQLSFDVYA